MSEWIEKSAGYLFMIIPGWSVLAETILFEYGNNSGAVQLK
jgi:hypothetical protein